MKFLNKILCVLLSACFVFGTAVSAAEENNIAPVNFTSNNAGSTFTISWINPARDDISSIELFSAEEDNILLASSNDGVIDTSSSAVNYYVYKADKPIGTVYTFRIEITYTDGKTFISEINSDKVSSETITEYTNGYSAIEDSQEVSRFKLWVKNNPMHKVSVTTNEAHGGKASLKITTNMRMPTYAGGDIQKCNMGILKPNANLRNNTSYKVSFYAKAIDDVTPGEISYGVGEEEATGMSFETIKAQDVPDWTLYEYTFVKPSTGSFYFRYTNANILIDDLEIYALDSEGNKTGSNMAANGNFERAVKQEEMAEVDNLRADENGEFISWDNPADANYDKIYLYEKYNGYENKIKEFSAETTSYDLALLGFENGRHELVVRTENNFGNLSAGKELTVDVKKVEINAAPSNFISVSEGDSYNISWINPLRKGIGEINLYDISDGSSVLLATSDGGSLSTENEKVNAYSMESTKEIGYKYKFMLEIKYKDGVKYTTVLETEPKTATGDYYEYAIYNGANMTAKQPTSYKIGWKGKPCYDISVQTKEVHSGNAALLLNSNTDGGTLFISTSAGVNSDVKYRLSFYVKKADNRGGTIDYGLGPKHDTQQFYSADVSEFDDWTKLTCEFTKTFSETAWTYLGGLYLSLSGASVYLDDIELYTVDENGNVSASNTVPNSGFEQGVMPERPDDVSDVSVIEEDGKVDISYKKPDDASKVIVYGDYEGYSNPVCVSTSETAAVMGLTNENEYEFVIKTVNQYGIESNGVKVTATPKTDKINVTRFVLTDENGKNSDLKAGKITAEVGVKNNFMGDGFNTVFVSALYKDGILIECHTDKKVLDTASANDDHTIFKNVVNVPNEAGEYKLALMLWDDMDSINIISNSREYNLVIE